MSGDGLVPPLNAPAAGQLSPGVQPGAQSLVVLAQYVIIFGAAGSLFVYSGTPAAGNLIYSITAAAGTDLFGNLIPNGGAVSYGLSGGRYEALNVNAGQLNWYIGGATEAGPWTGGSGIDGRSNVLNMAAQDMQFAIQENLLFFQNGTVLGAQFSLVTPSGDLTGATDSINLLNAVNNGTTQLVEGTYHINAPLVIPGGTLLDMGGGQIQPGSGWAGGELIELAGSYPRLRNGRLYGGSNTVGSNPAADAVLVPAGTNYWWAEDLQVDFVNGWTVNVKPSGATHGTIKGIKGTGDLGGIRIVSNTGSTVTAEVALQDVNIQSIVTNPFLFCQFVDDIQADNLNCSMVSSAGNPAIQVADGCQTIIMSNLDIGGVASGTTATLQVGSIAAGTAPTECDFSGGTVQDSGVGVLVTGTAARIRFRGIMSKRAQTDGWQFSGTGTAILVDGCAGNLNNQSAGTGYDINVTSTAHVGIFQFAYASSAVTNSLIVPAGNHVSNVNSTNPGGAAVSGAPAGW